MISCRQNLESVCERICRTAFWFDSFFSSFFLLLSFKFVYRFFFLVSSAPFVGHLMRCNNVFSENQHSLLLLLSSYAFHGRYNQTIFHIFLLLNVTDGGALGWTAWEFLNQIDFFSCLNRLFVFVLSVIIIMIFVVAFIKMFSSLSIDSFCERYLPICMPIFGKPFQCDWNNNII